MVVSRYELLPIILVNTGYLNGLENRIDSIEMKPNSTFALFFYSE